MKNCFYPADVLLPDFSKTSGEKWATIACDQFTSEPEYWEAADRFVGDEPSALRLILPEVYLDETETRVPEINAKMEEYLLSVFKSHPETMIFVERTQPSGGVRSGIIGAVDLEAYDYKKGSRASIRATEETVLERIPPRVAIRRDAEIELHHIMMLYDDSDNSLCNRISENIADYTLAYDFDLMMGAGHIEGYYLSADMAQYVSDYIEGKRAQGLSLCVGDGNHSLASAKALYEEIKAQIGEDAARVHPARYALCEIVNIHSQALDFEPIHRLIVKCDTDELLAFFKEKCKGTDTHTLRYITKDGEGEIKLDKSAAGISVDPLQKLLDEYLSTHKAEIDYIHGDESLVKLSQKEDAIGIFCEPISKGGLFEAVKTGGSLPRKTFSMGVALEKRHYLEARKIR